METTTPLTPASIINKLVDDCDTETLKNALEEVMSQFLIKATFEEYSIIEKQNLYYQFGSIKAMLLEIEEYKSAQ